MPWSPEEAKTFQRLKDENTVLRRDLEALKQDVRELVSAKDRQRDQERHEWRTMLDGAKRALTGAFEAQVQRMNEGFALLEEFKPMGETLREVRDELLERKAKESMRVRIEKEQTDRAELARVTKQAEREHKIKVWGVAITLLGILAGLVTATIASHH